MLLKQEGLLHRGPEFCQAFKFVIKLQISTLLQQLAESGEESVVLTANVSEGTADHLGSDRGAGFLDDHEQLQKQFLSYCTETRRFSVDDDPDTLARTGSYIDSTLLSPTQVTCRVLSPGLYSRGPVRPRYERESSTSDSVFSPNRRKSSASSKSLDDDVAMLSGQDFPEMNAKQLSESWPEPSQMLSVDPTSDKFGKYSSSRSPSARSIGDPSDKMKHASKSPTADSVEILKQISLSSPTEYKGRQGHLGANIQEPVIGPLSAPPMSRRFSPSSSSSDSITFTFKSNTAPPGIMGSVSSPVNVASSSSISPVNLVGVGGGGGGGMKSGVIYSPGGVGGTMGLDTGGLSQEMMYKVPFSSYGDGRLKSGAPSADVDNNNMYGEKEDGDNKYRLQFSGHEPSAGQTDMSSAVCAEGTEYQTESGETYRLHKKAEAKAYQRQMSTGRKQSKTAVERRSSESMMSSSYDQTSHLASPFLHADDKDLDKSMAADGVALSVSKPGDIILQPDLSKSFEDSVKVQQTIFQFHSSLGLLSPIHRQFLPPARMHVNRERSQSMSEFSVTSLEQTPPVRSRFPSSSYVENLDTPLIIDDDGKMETGMEEGLDLSNKKRKMSVDDVYHGVADDQQMDNSNISTNQGEEQDFGGVGGYASQNSSSSSSVSRDDQSAKKYGKGNFIKVATGYQCRICCRVIRHMNNTTAHMRIHANIKPYKCQVCNQQFKYEVDRRYHFSKSHVDLFSKMYFPDDKKNG